MKTVVILLMLCGIGFAAKQLLARSSDSIRPTAEATGLNGINRRMSEAGL